MYHILYDKMTTKQRAALLEHLVALQPEVVNVAGAERYPESLTYVQQILALCPETIVFERRIAKPDNQGGDEGIHLLPVDEWYAWRVEPYLDILSHDRVVVVYDNESMDADLTFYASQMATAMDRAERDDVVLAVGRFATGNPGEHQYEQLDEMWKRLAYGYHWWSPNEYAGPNPQASAGHLNRFMLGWRRCDELGINRPLTAIGETGVLKAKPDGLDPHKGYKSLGWSEAQCADAFIENSREWHVKYGVPVCYFAPETDGRIDKMWGDMTVGEGFYARVFERRAELVTPPFPTPQPPPHSDGEGEIQEPGFEYRLYEVVLVNLGTSTRLFVRERADRESAKVGAISAGQMIEVAAAVQGAPLSDLGDEWIPVRLAAGVTGYVHSYYVHLTGDEPGPDEPLVDAAAIREQMKQEIIEEIEALKARVLGL